MSLNFKTSQKYSLPFKFSWVSMVPDPLHETWALASNLPIKTLVARQWPTNAYTAPAKVNAIVDLTPTTCWSPQSHLGHWSDYIQEYIKERMQHTQYNNVYTTTNICMWLQHLVLVKGVDNGGARGAEAPPDFSP